jgi:hypothetical protein
MKRAQILKAGSIKVRPLTTEDFMMPDVKPARMEKVTKKQIREMAEEMGLAYDEEKILFARKILTHWMKKQ